MSNNGQDEDIKSRLKRIHQEEYPNDLKTATRAEFVTNIRKNQPKKGCRRWFGLMLGGLLVIICKIIMAVSTSF